MNLKNYRKKLIETYGNKYKETLGLDNSLWFGKFKNHTIEQIIEYDITYIEWCLEGKIFKLNNVAYNYYTEKLEEHNVNFNSGQREAWGLGSDHDLH